ncbi:MAG: right-handed parallel beta-helix repeat-containing protein, partial [Bacteroidota bacterium]
LDCSGVSTPTTWQNGSAAIDYVVPNGCVIDITDVLTIEPGTVVQFEENSGLGIYNNGALKAVGTENLPIVLEGKDNVRGYWRGIHLETNTLNNQLDHVTIANAGSNYVYCCNTPASLFLKGGTISIKNTTIRGGSEYGIYANGASSLREYENLTITEHSEAPLFIDVERISELDGLGSDYSGNDQAYIKVLDSDVGQETRIPANNVPYLFEGQVYNVTEALTIEEGVEIAFEENGGLGVYDNGSLKVNGTAGKPVIIRGLESSRGYWRGLHVASNSINNVLNWLEIRDAGSDYVYCCNTVASLYIPDGKVNLENVSISNGAAYGIATKAAATFSGFESVSVTTHTQRAMAISLAQAGELDGTASTFVGNDVTGIEIYGAQMSVNTTVPEMDVPYVVTTNVVLGVTAALTLQPGVSFEFEGSAGMGIFDNGSLNAEGRAGKIITFKGTEAVKGWWRGIHTETNSLSNVLDYVEIRNAGSNYVYCCNDLAGLLVRSGQMTLRNSVVSDNDGCGVFVRSGATLTESNNTFSNNTDGDTCN